MFNYHKSIKTRLFIKQSTRIALTSKGSRLHLLTRKVTPARHISPTFEIIQQITLWGSTRHNATTFNLQEIQVLGQKYDINFPFTSLVEISNKLIVNFMDFPFLRFSIKFGILLMLLFWYIKLVSLVQYVWHMVLVNIFFRVDVSHSAVYCKCVCMIMHDRSV